MLPAMCQVYMGFDESMLDGLDAGLDGAVGIGVNAQMTAAFVGVAEAHKRGDMPAAQEGVGKVLAWCARPVPRASRMPAAGLPAGCVLQCRLCCPHELTCWSVCLPVHVLGAWCVPGLQQCCRLGSCRHLLLPAGRRWVCGVTPCAARVVGRAGRSSSGRRAW